jgi:hypothetical protein
VSLSNETLLLLRSPQLMVLQEKPLVSPACGRWGGGSRRLCYCKLGGAQVKVLLLQAWRRPMMPLLQDSTTSSRSPHVSSSEWR